MSLNIPSSNQERIVIIGAGFAGLRLAKKLSRRNFQVVLIDRNNYHQFQPLYYQVAMAGLEPSSISFPLRKLFQHRHNVFIRICELQSISSADKEIQTSLGSLSYDRLVLALGAKTNFFGNKKIEEHAYSLKTVGEALTLRNSILQDYEAALLETDYDERQGLIDIVIVGGGPTGVELAGALAEMKSHILPKDYHELNNKEVDIYLIQAGPDLLAGMSEKSSRKAEDFLKKIGVHVLKDTRVTEFDGKFVHTNTGQKIRTNKVIWAAGIVCPDIEGIPKDSRGRGNRIKVDQQCRVAHMDDVYAIGDLAVMEEEKYEYGHPQVAQVAIQQADFLARKIIKKDNRVFEYKDKGSMATIGRNKAVCDLPFLSFTGFSAWVVWLFVHLFSLIGSKNKVIVFLNWIYGYLTYDQSLRLIIQAADKGSKKQEA